MKFKHSFHVFVDNFSVTYKQLLYRLVIILIACGLYAAVIIPFVNGLMGSPDFINFRFGIKALLDNLLEGNITEIGTACKQIREAFEALIRLVVANRGTIAWGIVGVIVIYLVQRFFEGLGNYATAAVINDKMALRANSPFLITLIRNLKEACLYNLMYIPLSFVFDAICYAGIYFIIFRLLPLFFPLQLFLYTTAMVVAISFKMVFTSDWLPSLIRGKSGQKKAFLYTFDRRGKNTFTVLSNFVVLILIIFAVNVMAIICTFGAAALLTVPSSYVVILSFEFVNYYDREKLKYFVDKNTIIRPEKEHTPTREEFFKGE